MRAIVIAIIGLVAISGPARADEVTALKARANAAYKAKRYDESVKHYRAALRVLPSIKDRDARRDEAAGIHYNLACDLALLGRTNEALAELAEAVDNGDQDRAWAEHDDDLTALRGAPAFAGLLQRMTDNEAAPRVYDVRVVANPDLDPVAMQHFGTIGNATSRELRTTYKLDAIVQGKRTQLERQLALLDWVHRQWQHDGTHGSSEQTALAILKQVSQGQRFACVDYGYTLQDVLMAFGYAARVPSLQSDADLKHGGYGHRVSEVWNDELQKWIVLDAQNNAVWRDGERYLNASEAREAIAHDPEHVRFERAPSPWAAVKPEDEPALRAFWGAYFAHLFFDGVNFVVPGERVELLDKGGDPIRQLWTSDVREIYPHLNLVHVDLLANKVHDMPSSGLDVQLRHNMPGFDHYHVVRNGTHADTKATALSWQLRAGANSLEIYAVNAEGVRGASSRIDVHYYPPRR